MGNLKGRALTIFVLVLWKHLGFGQTIVTPPMWTTLEQVTSLVKDPKQPNHLQFAIRTFIHAENNVLPLKLGNDERLPPINFHGDCAYFADYRMKELSLSHRRWTLRHGYGKADFYEGNRDAAQLYLDTMSVGANPQKDYDVNASLSRTFLRRWTLEYTAPLKRGQGQFSVAFHWLRVHRLQKGTLTGQMSLGQFDGDLLLLTTRGLPSSETKSNGVSVDFSAVAPIGERIKLGIWCENAFSKIWQRRLQQITAKVSTNKVEPDADGFLHAVPFLQGRIEKVSMEARAKQIWVVGAAFKQGGEKDWVLIAKGETNWHIGIGCIFSFDREKRIWVMFNAPQPFWQVGISTSHFQFLLGVDKWSTTEAKEIATVVRLHWTF
ncbi:MAG: hypothetical protein N3B10_02305 [Armatimonadetes bacterium]|nr:hypothetical protein [Armatimonadota bacterium]